MLNRMLQDAEEMTKVTVLDRVWVVHHMVCI